MRPSPPMLATEQNANLSLRDPAILRLFQAQLGIASRAQLLAAGVHRDAIGRELRAGRLVRVHDGVYRLASATESPEQILFAATLAVSDAVVSHRSAAWLHGFAGFERLEFVEVSTAG